MTPKLVDERHRRASSRIKAIRRGLDMTQQEFAVALSVAVSTVVRWEQPSGQRVPSPMAERMIRDLCAQYGFDQHQMRRFAV